MAVVAFVKIKAICETSKGSAKHQRGQASLMFFSFVGEVELAGIATVIGILNNELPFETASDLQTAFGTKGFRV